MHLSSAQLQLWAILQQRLRMTAFKSSFLLWELSHLLQRCFLAKRGLPRQLDVCILIDALKEKTFLSVKLLCKQNTLITKSRFHITENVMPSTSSEGSWWICWFMLTNKLLKFYQTSGGGWSCTFLASCSSPVGGSVPSLEHSQCHMEREPIMAGMLRDPWQTTLAEVSFNLDLISCHGRCIIRHVSYITSCTLILLYIKCFKSLTRQDSCVFLMCHLITPHVRNKFVPSDANQELKMLLLPSFFHICSSILISLNPPEREREHVNLNVADDSQSSWQAE